MKSLLQQLTELDHSRNPHRRGALFESFVAQILEEEGYDVSINPKTAPPRQTDLFAIREEQSFLIEAKWLSKRAHVGQVSSVRERLSHCPSSVFGCIFSMSEFTNEAIADPSRYREHEIFLFDGSEVRGIASGAFTFAELLLQKKEALRKDATVWFSDWTPEKDQRTGFRLGPGTIHWNGKPKYFAFSATSSDDVLFSTELLDFAGKHRNSVFSLDLTLHLYTIDDLHRLIQILRKHIPMEGQDSFAIHQRGGGWYGLGLDAFLFTAKNWQARYAELKWNSYHHSEELAYFDRLSQGGLMCLTSRQSVGSPGDAHLHSSYLEIFFPGIPVDMSAVRRLCKLVKNPGANLEMVGTKPVETIRFQPRIPVEAVGTIVCESNGTPMVSGLIVRNPFYGKKPPRREKSYPGDPLKFLSNNEYLLCSMKQWHVLGHRNVKYELRFAEACWVENIPVLHIACDWKEDPKNIRRTTSNRKSVKTPGSGFPW